MEQIFHMYRMIIWFGTKIRLFTWDKWIHSPTYFISGELLNFITTKTCGINSCLRNTIKFSQILSWNFFFEKFFILETSFRKVFLRNFFPIFYSRKNFPRKTFLRNFFSRKTWQRDIICIRNEANIIRIQKLHDANIDIFVSDNIKLRN